MNDLKVKGENILCIYHGNCADGYTAAWALRRYYPEAEFHAGVYQETPPDCTGKHVYIVDFSYKRDVLEKIIEQADMVTILDHHESARDDLIELMSAKKIKGVFDMKRSGAMIVWDWFFPREEAPQIIKHVQDRDLWKFELEGTREIQAAVFSYEYTWENWDRLMAMDRGDIKVLRLMGEAIERKHFKDIRELMEKCRKVMMIDGYHVMAYNLPYTMSSDVGQISVTEKHAPFGVCYWDTPSHREFSLRSTDDRPSVKDIAVKFGGGGHRNAAGFKVPLDHELAYGGAT